MLRTDTLPELSGFYAIFGGSFDPVHMGHLSIASQILERTAVAKVVFMPNNKHRFKPSELRLPFEQRCKLLKLAIGTDSGFELWLDDATGTGYTADLIVRIRNTHPELNFCFVLGSDNLRTLVKWHNYQWLRENLHFLIIPRPGEAIEPSLTVDIKYSLLHTDPSDISSTAIRTAIQKGQSISGMVPGNIESLIYETYRRFYEKTR